MSRRKTHVVIVGSTRSLCNRPAEKMEIATDAAPTCSTCSQLSTAYASLVVAC